MRALMVSSFTQPPAVVDVDSLPCGPRDVRIGLRAAGICHSDLSAARGVYPFPLPMVLGHEGVGVVEEVGPAVADVGVGDRVVASWVPSCGRCYQCLRSRSHLCETQGSVGSLPRVRWQGQVATAMSGLGTMAESMTVEQANVVVIDSTLPDEQLALIGCTITTGVGAALWTAGVEPGSSVAVIGCGGVGLSVIQGCAIAGATEIIAVDPVPLKRDAAVKYGATATIDPVKYSVVDEIRGLTGGRGAEFTFEAVGRAASMRDVFDAACNGGTITFLGALPASVEATFPANALRANGKQLRGSVYGSAQVRRDMPRLARLAETGRLDLASMVSDAVSLERAVEAFEALESGAVIRSVIVP